jgi:4Fe-4S ferredoxin
MISILSALQDLFDQMNPRVEKRETRDLLELSLEMFIDRISLHLDKQVCLKCDICSVVCPRQAVEIIAREADLDITIDPRRCVLCEICSHFCPVAAVNLSFNGTPKTILLNHQGLAPFFPKIKIDTDKCPQPCPENLAAELHWCRHQRQLIAATWHNCPKHCHICLEACPRQAITRDESGLQILAQPDLCLRCTQCLPACPYDAIQVTPQFRGSLVIEDQKCPSDCQKCINLCPVQAIGREGGRVLVKTSTCSLCGVCHNICDQEAITLRREEVVAEPGDFSQAWENALNKLLGN